MKKLLSVALLALVVFPLVAQEAAPADGTEAPKAERRAESSMWPAFIAVSQLPQATDVVGLRLTIPYSTSQVNVTGVDLGFWGRATSFEGIQLNLLRNDVTDDAAGFQVGIYNSIAFGSMVGAQVGLWNEAVSFTGVQAGLINVVGDGCGFQIGLVNRAETFHGYQIGLINVIRDADVKFMPIVNIGF